MKVTRFHVKNIKSIVDSELELGPVTLLVGKNNAGKSTLLRCLYAMQEQGQLGPRDIRFGEAQGVVSIDLQELNAQRHWNTSLDAADGRLTVSIDSSGGSLQSTLTASTGQTIGVGRILNTSPQSFIFPFLARRRGTGYSEQITRSQALVVGPDMQNLVARVDTLMDSHHPRHGEFIQLLDEVVRLPLSAIASDNGKRIGMWVNVTDVIYFEEMGDGVAQLLGFITNLCLARKQLFVIEELENDVHPEALKLLLTVIEKRRHENQFILSTHNNIVMRNLGSLPDTRIYEVTSAMSDGEIYNLPTSKVEQVGTSPEERTSLLKHLGYELSDLDLWDGWLLLEEASAERIVRDHLIRWFVPELSRVRTLAANGTGDVDPSFSALYKLVLYTHLEERYRGRVAVMLDGDQSGIDTIAMLQGRYPGWPSKAFSTFSKPDFERYYPDTFELAANEALAIRDKTARRKAKRELLLQVLAWIEGDDAAAQEGFSHSAADVIAKLREFAGSLGPASSVA